MRRVLVLWWDGRPVGELVQDAGGDLGFTYGVDWLGDPGAPALSASLPKRAGSFSRKQCRPFFGGLLPEEAQRKAAAQALGISAANDFAMLDRIGGEVAGALQFLRPGERPQAPEGPWAPRPLSDEELLRILETLPRRPLLVGEQGLRLSLAGAQSKVPVVLAGSRLALPLPGQPTTHILKPAIPHFEASTENEAFAMRLAACVGLDVAGVAPLVLRPAGAPARTMLLVDRYDRVRTSAQVVHRLHQEDFCQALGVPVEHKYQSEGGPTLGDGFALLRRISVRPALDVLKLLDAAIFNTVIGNADAHGKNFSILYADDGPRLAPLYDLLSTVVYPDLSAEFAMKIGRQTRLEELDAKSWAAFATLAGLGLPMVRRRVGELASRIRVAAPSTAGALAETGLDPEALRRISDLVEARSLLCAASLDRR